MNIGSAFPGQYIKAADLQGRKISVMVSHVAMEEIGGDHKPVCYFMGKDRGLVLNKTNASIIAEMHGWETDDWQGKPIILYPARVEFQGRIVDAIRVELTIANSTTQKPAHPAPVQPLAGNGSAPVRTTIPAADISDDIPF